MSKFFDDTMQGILEAVEINVAEEREKELIDEMISIRKEKNISQTELANITGNKQQAISRLEKKENSPSLKSFLNTLNALGYDLQLVRAKHYSDAIKEAKDNDCNKNNL